MSTIANLDVNLRGNTTHLDSAFEASKKKVTDFGSDVKKKVKEADTKTKDAGSSAMARMQGVVTNVSTMASNVIKGVSSGSLSGLIGGLSSAGTAAAMVIGGPVAAAVVGAVSGMLGSVASGVEKIGARIGESLTALSSLALASRNLGVGTADLAGLQRAGQLAGLGLGEANAALKAFAQNSHQAGVGTGPSLLALRQLGLHGKELADLPLADRLASVADRLSQVGNAGDRVRLAQGLGLEAMLPALEQGSEGIRKIVAQSKAMGIGDPAGAKAAREASLAWGQFNASLDAMWDGIASALAPLARDVATWLAKIGESAIKYVGEGARIFGEFAKVVWKVWDASKGVVDVLLKIVSPLYLIGRTVMDSAGTWDHFKEKALTAIFAAEWAVDNWKEAIGVAFDWGKLAVVTFGNTIVHVFTVVIPAAVRAVGEAFNRIGTGLGEAMAKMGRGDFDGAADAMKKSFSDAFDGMGDRMREAMRRAPTELEVQLQARLNRRAEGVNDHVARRMREFDKPREGGEVKDGARMGGLPMKAASMEFGSKEAFSTIYGTVSAQEKALHVANLQLVEARALREEMIRARQEARNAPRLRRWGR